MIFIIIWSFVIIPPVLKISWLFSFQVVFSSTISFWITQLLRTWHVVPPNMCMWKAGGGVEVWVVVWRGRKGLVSSMFGGNSRISMFIWFFHVLVGSFCVFQAGVIKYTHLGGIKKWDECMVMLRDFPYINALFGLVSYNDPCLNHWFWNRCSEQWPFFPPWAAMRITTHNDGYTDIPKFYSSVRNPTWHFKHILICPGKHHHVSGGSWNANVRWPRFCFFLSLIKFITSHMVMEVESFGGVFVAAFFLKKRQPLWNGRFRK